MKGKADAPAEREGGGLRPWHLLLVGGLASATAAAVMTGGTGTANSIFVVVSVWTAALVAVGVYRTLAPFIGADGGEQAEMLAGRTRAAVEREKFLVLRSIKEVEFDRAMKKISDADFQEISVRLRQRAAGLMRQLDGDAGYRALIERDLAGLLGSEPEPARAPGAPGPASAAGVTCAACGTSNDGDARFCKGCGTALTGGAS